MMWFFCVYVNMQSGGGGGGGVTDYVILLSQGGWLLITVDYGGKGEGRNAK